MKTTYINMNDWYWDWYWQEASLRCTVTLTFLFTNTYVTRIFQNEWRTNNSERIYAMYYWILQILKCKQNTLTVADFLNYVKFIEYLIFFWILNFTRLIQWIRSRIIFILYLTIHTHIYIFKTMYIHVSYVLHICIWF